MERQVVLLSRDAGLASTIDRLLTNGDRIAHFSSLSELADWTAPQVAAVVLDSQPNARRLSYKQVRERYHGPLVVLLDKDEQRPDLPPDGACQFLHRPFQVAELSTLLDAPMPRLGSFEAAIIAAWSRHATTERPVRPTRDPSYRIGSRRTSLRRRIRVWGATTLGLVALLLAFGLSDQGGSCAPACTKFGGSIAGAAENETPLTSTPSGGSAAGGSQGGQPPGSSAASSSQPPTPPGGASFPVVTGVGGLIESINPITGGDPTPPSGPEAVPGVPAPAGVSLPPGTSPPGTTPPPTTGPPTTAPPTTAPPTTAPPTTAPPTTEPPTTAPPTTAPPTTAPPTTAPPTTAPPTTAADTTAPPTTAPTTAEPTAAPTT